MAESAPSFRGGFGGATRASRRGRGRGRARGRRPEEKKEWLPVTKLGRLVRDSKISSLEEIYLHALPIKEYEIIDYFLGSSLNDEVSNRIFKFSYTYRRIS